MEDDTDELTFQPLAAPTAKVLLRILAEPRERPCEGDILKTFQDMQEARTNSNRAPIQKHGRR